MKESKIDRVILIVLDSCGCGAAPDAKKYGDDGSNTLGNMSVKVGGLTLPHLQGLGLGHLTTILGVPPVAAPRGAFGKMREASAGKDTTTGHWEMAGLQVDTAFPTFPDGFPAEMMKRFEQKIGRGTLGNKTASGTEIIEELGVEHLKTGKPIVYTSADSVFQIAMHEEIIPVDEQLRISEAARLLCDEIPVARVIMRPFVGEPGAFKRTYNRRDLSMPPPTATILDSIADAKLPVVGVGKISDIFAGRGITENVHSEGNADGCVRTLEAMERVERGLVFTNLVDFDMLYGHRRDPEGYYRALQEFDAFLPRLQSQLGPRDLVMITADHGNDPTYRGTDHTREYVPLIAMSARAAGHDLGVRNGFYDIAQTLADAFGLQPRSRGLSFLSAVA
ncbi:MAG: Phosphopentomutase [Myxococcales bacterium]|nr:Phosphopentomutase [Myxococcales bacterium]